MVLLNLLYDGDGDSDGDDEEVDEGVDDGDGDGVDESQAWRRSIEVFLRRKFQRYKPY